MSLLPIVIFSTALGLRIASIAISIINERKLLSLGAREFDRQNSRKLIVGHCFFYAMCVLEGWQSRHFLDGPVGYGGLALYGFSIFALYYVIYALRHIWTFKLIIAPQWYHTLNDNLIFRYVKHPNYYLNVIPELIGFALIFHAHFSFVIVFPLHLMLLVTRIKREENVMKQHFENY